VALVLHGGQETSLRPTRPWNAAAARMIPFARAISLAGSDGGLVVARLRYAVRGWNGETQSPVTDARWALASLEKRFADLPVVLVGHSMGGRVALALAGTEHVRAVVALAPWVERDDPPEPVSGRRLLIVHGVRDHVTSPRRSAAFAERARGAGAQVTFVGVRNDGHAMLRRPHLWHALTAQFVRGVVAGSRPGGATDLALANLVRRVLAGEYSLVV
jgi:dienelactone hydrolase